MPASAAHEQSVSGQVRRLIDGSFLPTECCTRLRAWRYWQLRRSRRACCTKRLNPSPRSSSFPFGPEAPYSSGLPPCERHASHTRTTDADRYCRCDRGKPGGGHGSRGGLGNNARSVRSHSFRDLRRCRVVKGVRPGLGTGRHAAAETALHRAVHRFGTPTEGRTARRVAPKT
jgi:hypothetical protein